jgi:hypothetical protein
LRAGFRHLLFDFVLRAEAEGADEGEGAYMPASVLVGQVAAPPPVGTDRSPLSCHCNPSVSLQC